MYSNIVIIVVITVTTNAATMTSNTIISIATNTQKDFSKDKNGCLCSTVIFFKAEALFRDSVSYQG